MKEQKAELAQFEQRCQQQQTESVLDPSALAKERLNLVAQHEIDRASLEIQVSSMIGQ